MQSARHVSGRVKLEALPYQLAYNSSMLAAFRGACQVHRFCFYVVKLRFDFASYFGLIRERENERRFLSNFKVGANSEVVVVKFTTHTWTSGFESYSKAGREDLKVGPMWKGIGGSFLTLEYWHPWLQGAIFWRYRMSRGWCHKVTSPSLFLK